VWGWSVERNQRNRHCHRCRDASVDSAGLSAKNAMRHIPRRWQALKGRNIKKTQSTQGFGAPAPP